MFSVWVTTQIVPGKASEFLAAIEVNARASVRDEPGCLYFDVIELDRDLGRYGFYEVYTNRAAFEIDHRAAPHYAAWKAGMVEFIEPGAHHNTTGERLLSFAPEAD